MAVSRSTSGLYTFYFPVCLYLYVGLLSCSIVACFPPYFLKPVDCRCRTKHIETYRTNCANAGCEDGGVRLWNLEQGLMVRLLYSHPAWVRVTSFTGDHVASSCEDNTVCVWDMNTNSLVLVCAGIPGLLMGFALARESFKPDRRLW